MGTKKLGPWLFVALVVSYTASLVSAAATAAAATAAAVPPAAAVDTHALPYTGTTTRVQTSLPIITFGNEWEDVVIKAAVISADYNTTHEAPSSGLIMFSVQGGGWDGTLENSVIGVMPVVPSNVTGISTATLRMQKSDSGIPVFPGDYSIIASYTGSKDGAFLASVGSTPMFVSLLTFPISWRPVEVPAKKLRQMEVLRDFLN